MLLMPFSPRDSSSNLFLLSTRLITVAALPFSNVPCAVRAVAQLEKIVVPICN